ncbi:MAG TPA: hypothetical protein VGB66_03980, partial [Longimicrobium sp.]
PRRMRLFRANGDRDLATHLCFPGAAQHEPEIETSPHVRVEHEDLGCLAPNARGRLGTPFEKARGTGLGDKVPECTTSWVRAEANLEWLTHGHNLRRLHITGHPPSRTVVMG